MKSRSPFVGQLFHGLWPLGGGLTWRSISSPKRSSRGGLSRSLTLVACVVISPISTISWLAFWPRVDNRRYLQVRKSVHHTASKISVTVAQSHIDHFIVVPGAGLRARSHQGLSAAAARRCRRDLRRYHSFAGRPWLYTKDDDRGGLASICRLVSRLPRAIGTTTSCCPKRTS